MQPTVERIPVLFVIQTSGDTRKTTEDRDGYQRTVIDCINQGLEDFKQELNNDYQTQKAVDVSVVSYGGTIRTEQNFQPIDVWEPSRLTAQGHSPMCEAIVKGITHLEEYKTKLVEEGIPMKQPLIFLLTDGNPTDGPGTEIWRTAQNIIKEGLYDDRFSLYASVVAQHGQTETLNDLLLTTAAGTVETLDLREEHHSDFFNKAAQYAKDHTKEND